MTKNLTRQYPDLFNNFIHMTKERILAMIEKLLKIYEELEEDGDYDMEENNLVECI